MRSGRCLCSQTLQVLTQTQLNIYKKTIHPKYGCQISFIGFARPSVGSIPPISELQARFVSLAIAGRVKIPTKVNLLEQISIDRKFEEFIFTNDSERLPSLCSYLETITDWASMLGCDVQFWRLLVRRPTLLYRIFFGQILPTQFRLFGEGRPLYC